jgi:hypothetical protein
MDSTITAGVAAVLGSVVGAAATICTAWITQRAQAERNIVELKLRGREALYADFITEASRLAVDALAHQLEQLATFVPLYGVLGRIRLVAAPPVLAAAEACCRQIADLYAKPNMTIDQIRTAFDDGQIDPIKEFSTACRAELHGIAQGSLREG